MSNERASISICRARAHDLEELVKLRLLLSHETGDIPVGASDVEFEKETRAYVQKSLESEQFFCWIAVTDEGRIVGTSGLVFLEKPPTYANRAGLEAYVMNMYSLPEWRGKGVASAILQALIAFVKATDAKRIWLHTNRFWSLSLRTGRIQTDTR